jgi:NAD(P)-dependent dehydrogenase (short-subunit alcohol dehydrogenase family)
MQLAIAEMVKQGSGHVVQITTSLVDNANASLAAVLASLTKGGLNATPKSLAIEYAKRGIRMNAVALGIINSTMHPGETYAQLGALNPVGHMGEISDGPSNRQNSAPPSTTRPLTLSTSTQSRSLRDCPHETVSGAQQLPDSRRGSRYQRPEAKLRRCDVEQIRPKTYLVASKTTRLSSADLFSVRPYRRRDGP